MSRVHPSVDITHISPNVSSRHGRKPKIIVLHATVSHNRPGVKDLRDLGNWFAQRSSRVSCHVATDAEGNSGRYVWDSDKAWQCSFYNSAALGIEQIWISGESWHIEGVRESARWAAHWGKKYGIPMRRGAVFGGVVTRSGIVTHKQLGRLGGGHTDPPGYPINIMIKKAQWYRTQI
jgi:hypothetical protein